MCFSNELKILRNVNNVFDSFMNHLESYWSITVVTYEIVVNYKFAEKNFSVGFNFALLPLGNVKNYANNMNYKLILPPHLNVEVIAAEARVINSAGSNSSSCSELKNIIIF